MSALAAALAAPGAALDVSTRPRLHQRPMALADLEAVMAIEAQCYSHPWSRGNFTDCLSKAAYALWLFEVQPDAVHSKAQASVLTQKLVGYSVAMQVVDEWHLLNLSVAPQWQRQGLGRRLLGHVCQQALLHAAPTVLLEVRASNVAAQALYQQAGFSKDGLRKGYYPAHTGREDAVLMRLILDPKAPHGLD